MLKALARWIALGAQGLTEMTSRAYEDFVAECVLISYERCHNAVVHRASTLLHGYAAWVPAATCRWVGSRIVPTADAVLAWEDGEYGVVIDVLATAFLMDSEPEQVERTSMDNVAHGAQVFRERFHAVRLIVLDNPARSLLVLADGTKIALRKAAPGSSTATVGDVA